MNKIKTFTDLYAWQKGHEMVRLIYLVANDFPEDEKFGLTSQIKRSAVSVTSNIAEGFGRSGKQDKVRFFEISIGSLYEVQNQLLIANDMDYLPKDQYDKIVGLSIETAKLINSLKKGILGSKL